MEDRSQMQGPLRFTAVTFCAVCAAWAWSSAACAQASNTGAWSLDTRLRYESVVQDGLADADALTLRARLGYETPAFHNVRALMELEGVGHLTEDFNDTVNGNLAFAVVPDPEVFEVNRLQLAWSGRAGSRATIGRQRIVLGNGRFIGNSGFRQNEQTFDAVRLEARPSPHFALTYLYLDNIRRVFGDDSPQGVWRSDSHVLQADADLPLGKLSAYSLLLSFQNAPAQSSQTYGVRWTRAWDLPGGNARLALEAAEQSDYRGDSSDFDLGYQQAELAFRRGRVTATLGGERLEGDGVRGFSTPLASLHPFQGWADVFLSTPPDGVRDLYAGLSYSTRPWPADQPAVFTVVAHDFTDDGGGSDFGQELDASARWSLSEHAAFEAAIAVFDGEDPRFQDRTKIWATLEFRL
jgi:hypothetical protein